MTYAFIDSNFGYPPIEQRVLAPASLRDLTINPGFIAQVVDPVFGPGEVVFARANGNIRIAGLCAMLPVWDAATQQYRQNITEVANTANLGTSAYIYLGNTALTAGQYGWFLVTGIAPVNSNASVAANAAIGIANTGQAGANTAGKRIIGANVVAASSTTVVKAGRGSPFSNVIYFASGTQGMFAGQYASGTGVGASAIVTSVDADKVIVSVNNSAEITSNVTMTNNNGTIHYNTVQVSRPTYQGPIT